jgi:hypothetical protein
MFFKIDGSILYLAFIVCQYVFIVLREVECLNRDKPKVGSGAKHRSEREALLEAARRREIDVLIVWRLDPGADRQLISSLCCKN